MKMMLKMTGAILNSMAYSGAVKFYSLFVWIKFCLKTAASHSPLVVPLPTKSDTKWRTAKVVETTRVCTAHCDLNLKLRDHDQAEIRTKMFRGILRGWIQARDFLNIQRAEVSGRARKFQAVN